jgi:hypothetical protein
MYLVDDEQWDNFTDSLCYNIIHVIHIHIHQRETRPERVPLIERDTGVTLISPSPYPYR